MSGRIRLHNMVLHTKVLGPGARCAIWFQGCPRQCKGCMSPETRSLDGGRLINVQRICSEIVRLNDIEGITISGGEPFLQTDALFELLDIIKRTTNLGVIIYTGFTIEQLHVQKNIKIDAILSHLADLIIDGEYVDELNDGGSLIGSANQQLNFITERYVPYKHMYDEHIRNVEIRASKDELFFIGIPDKRTLDNWITTAHQITNGTGNESV